MRRRALAELIKKLKELPPPTEEQLFEQRVSFVYGQMNCDRAPGTWVSKDWVREQVRKYDEEKKNG